MKDTILMGMSGCGKTTLIQALLGEAVRYKKTQTVERFLHFIDTPGEYMEIRHFYPALLVSSVDADVIGLVHECGQETSWIPPAFSTTFAKPVIGIVTKTDLAERERDMACSREALERAGACPVFEVCALTGRGLTPLVEYLDDDGAPAERAGAAVWGGVL
jgi:ethanolamine utilization protein EutP